MLTQTQHPTTQAHTTKAAAEVRELIASLHKLESALLANEFDIAFLQSAKDEVKAKHTNLALSLRQTHDSACRSLKLHLESLPMSDVFAAMFEVGNPLNRNLLWIAFRARDISAVVGAVLASLSRRVASPFLRGRLSEECEAFCSEAQVNAWNRDRSILGSGTFYSLKPEYQALLPEENISFLRAFIAEAGLPQGLANR